MDGNERKPLTMRFRPQVIFSLLVLLFFIFFVYEAREWRLQARLYPWAIGIPMIFLAIVHLVLDLRGKSRKASSSDAPVDFQFTQTTDSALTQRRTINIMSWIFGFLISIWLLGFSLSVPLFVFLYLKVQSREGWILSLLLTGAAWLFFWGIFDRLLHLPFPDGQLLIWMGMI